MSLSCSRKAINKHTSNSFPMGRVQGLVNLVKQVEGGGVALLDGEDQGQGHERLLTARQLLHVSHLRAVARERHADADARELLHQGHFL